MDLIQVVLNKMIPSREHTAFRSGDTVGVYVKVKEGEKERLQLFKGVVIQMQGRGRTRSFTVRKISGGIGVERTFPFNSPSVEKIELIAKGTVRRSRLFYLRKLKGRAARLQSELVHVIEGDVAVSGADGALPPSPVVAE